MANSLELSEDRRLKGDQVLYCVVQAGCCCLCGRLGHRHRYIAGVIPHPEGEHDSLTPVSREMPGCRHCWILSIKTPAAHITSKVQVLLVLAQ